MLFLCFSTGQCWALYYRSHDSFPVNEWNKPGECHMDLQCHLVSLNSISLSHPVCMFFVMFYLYQVFEAESFYLNSSNTSACNHGSTFPSSLDILFRLFPLLGWLGLFNPWGSGVLWVCCRITHTFFLWGDTGSFMFIFTIFVFTSLPFDVFALFKPEP